ncbi:sulfite exporter TauE/SafE family protein [Methanobacterium alcaliphilum]|uniref:sulfite exporter TauE/SafE family protein n=1 Tax=Methanobacterium alcaliphilum TaxID=392018 RepID=UPI00200AB6BB|nr:sulfite exporter TauE/SafE family protein [Methanobacterium alcaliphilum]MCK9152310.1 sulfite exporter TauE/SafE family protein [Methanobacterium alcaliphilum]
MNNKKTSLLSLVIGAPIGCLGGLIGLGGAEFRLPFLLKTFSKTAKKAVALNMLISLITVASAIYFRMNNFDVSPIYPQILLMISLIVGSTTGAYFGIELSTKISDALFKKVLLILLLIMGLLLISESFITFGSMGILFSSLYMMLVVAILCGVLIGIISSLLGVAGGEVIIPILILIFGIDVKLAGTMSLIISLPTMLVGITRHAKNKMYTKKSEIKYLVIPMGVSSIIGASIGAFLVIYAPSELLKIILGALLIFTSIKLFTEKEE